MSKNLTTLASAILKEHFGQVVGKVGTLLMKQVSGCPLRFIVSNLSLTLDTVRMALRVLIQHNLCEFSLNEKNLVKYSVKAENVVLMLQYPRYVYFMQVLYGNAAELLVEEIINNGKLTMSSAINKVMERLRDASETKYTVQEIFFKFKSLVSRKFLCRCPNATNTSNNLVPNTSITEAEMFKIPKINFELFEVNTEKAKRQKVDFPDEGIYWKINHSRFKQHLRDQAIVTACYNRYDEKAAEIVKSIFYLSESELNPSTTKPIAKNDILSHISKTMNIKPKDLESYLSILSEGSSNFLSKANERADGMYVVNIYNMLEKLIKEMAISVVQDRFGSKCCRIFRIVLEKKYLEQKQIEELSMMVPKDAREYIYKMHKEGFIKTQEIPKAQDFIASRSILLIHIDMEQVIRMLLERSYLAACHAIICYETYNKDNKRLLEKKQRIDSIVSTLKQSKAEAAQIAEVQQMITPPEEALLNKIIHITRKLDLAQIQSAEMMLILAIWLEICKSK